MFDSNLYNQILNCAYDTLKENGGKLGREFCEGFMFDHDPGNGRQAESSVMALFNFVMSEGPRRFGSSSLTIDQLFDIVGSYITEIFNRWSSRNRSGGFSSRSSFLSSNSGGNLFGNNRGSFSNPQRAFSPGSHLGDSEESSRPKSGGLFDTSNKSTITEVAKEVAKANTPTEHFPDHPLDNIPDIGMGYKVVPTYDCWVGETPDNQTITVVKAYDLKIDDPAYTIRRTEAFMHRAVDNEVDVVNEFFKIVPPSIIARPYMFHIHYNHITTIPIETDTYIKLVYDINEICQRNIDTGCLEPFFKTVVRTIGSLLRRDWVAMSNYLTKHINRALYVACRLSNDPFHVLEIDNVDDLKELFGPGINSPLMRSAEQRDIIMNIVDSAVRNAMGENSGAMFKQIDFPVETMKTSTAFPESLRGVYYDKNKIPYHGEEGYMDFLHAMTRNILTYETYMVSKRTVTITNILGKYVLGNISDTPKMFKGKVCGLLNSVSKQYTNRVVPKGIITPYELPKDDEETTKNKLKDLYENRPMSDFDVQMPYNIEDETFLPVEHTLFATKWGDNPESYIKVMDVFETIDERNMNTDVILASKKIKSLNFV